MVNYIPWQAARINSLRHGPYVSFHHGNAGIAQMTGRSFPSPDLLPSLPAALLIPAGQVLVDEALFLPAVERDERSTAPGPVNGLRLRERGVFAVKIAKFHGTSSKTPCMRISRRQDLLYAPLRKMQSASCCDQMLPAEKRALKILRTGVSCLWPAGSFQGCDGRQTLL